MDAGEVGWRERGKSLEGCARDMSTCLRKVKSMIPDREAGKTDQQEVG